jgi:peptidoglycan L-alanyl-D-glutamate endopeptidase CwlK
VFSLGKKSIENLIGVDDELIDVVELAIEITKVDFGIPSTGGYRVEAEQAKLYTAGLSLCDGRVRLSKHQTGRAVDVFAYVNGTASYDTENLAMVAAAMLQASSQLNIELKWGGHFRSFSDMPHFELGG